MDPLRRASAWNEYRVLKPSQLRIGDRYGRFPDSRCLTIDIFQFYFCSLDHKERCLSAFQDETTSDRGENSACFSASL